MEPYNAGLAYTLAFFLHGEGQTDAAVTELTRIIKTKPAYPDVYLLLGSIYEQRGDRTRAIDVYARAQANDRLPPQLRAQFEERGRALLP